MSRVFHSLQILAQVDDLQVRLAAWSQSPTDWNPIRRGQFVVRRLLERVESLRTRLTAPLIVGTFGGTGSGKSTLINALVGREVTASGKERPTTRRPVLIAHQETDLSLLRIPSEMVTVVRDDAPLLRDMVLIDCPDPDTTEEESPDSNLIRLRQIVPHCDVLLVTATQLRYASARVNDELRNASEGCRIVFIQTRADLDSDIREDWKRQLDQRYEVADLFFVDSRQAFLQQQQGIFPDGEFGRLLTLLSEQLNASQRLRVRRANLADLAAHVMGDVKADLDRQWGAVSELQRIIDEQQQVLATKLIERLQTELQASQGLWERRLITAMTDQWGSSPFSTVLKLYNGLGSWLAAWAMSRAKTTAQLAILGAVEGARQLRQQASSQTFLDRLVDAGTLSGDDHLIREQRLTVTGYVRQAGFDARLIDSAETIEGAGLSPAEQLFRQVLEVTRTEVDAIVDRLSRRRGRRMRILCELILGLLLVYVGWRPAYNFFIGHPWYGDPLQSTDYYIHAGIFVGLAVVALVSLFTRTMRVGLNQEISQLAVQLARHQFPAGLWPRVSQAIEQADWRRSELATIVDMVQEIRQVAHQPSRLSSVREAVSND